MRKRTENSQRRVIKSVYPIILALAPLPILFSQLPILGPNSPDADYVQPGI